MFSFQLSEDKSVPEENTILFFMLRMISLFAGFSKNLVFSKLQSSNWPTIGEILLKDTSEGLGSTQAQ